MCCVFKVTGVSVSGGPDQLFCIHLTGGNDLVVCLQSRRDPNADLTGEAVGVMCRLFDQSVYILISTVVKFELLELYYKQRKVHKVKNAKNANNCIHTTTTTTTVL